MGKHDKAKQSYLEEGLLILSVAQEAPDLFEAATRDEKRELLDHLGVQLVGVTECSWNYRWG